MAATCNHCGREFRNAQAVRGHLGYCAAWLKRKGQAPRERKPREPRERSLGAVPLTGELGEHLVRLRQEQALLREQLKLDKLRAQVSKQLDLDAARSGQTRFGGVTLTIPEREALARRHGVKLNLRIR